MPNTAGPKLRASSTATRYPQTVTVAKPIICQTTPATATRPMGFTGAGIVMRGSIRRGRGAAPRLRKRCDVLGDPLRALAHQEIPAPDLQSDQPENALGTEFRSAEHPRNAAVAETQRLLAKAAREKLRCRERRDIFGQWQRKAHLLAPDQRRRQVPAR